MLVEHAGDFDVIEIIPYKDLDVVSTLRLLFIAHHAICIAYLLSPLLVRCPLSHISVLHSFDYIIHVKDIATNSIYTHKIRYKLTVHSLHRFYTKHTYQNRTESALQSEKGRAAERGRVDLCGFGVPFPRLMILCGTLPHFARACVWGRPGAVLAKWFIELCRQIAIVILLVRGVCRGGCICVFALKVPWRVTV